MFDVKDQENLGRLIVLNTSRLISSRLCNLPQSKSSNDRSVSKIDIKSINTGREINQQLVIHGKHTGKQSIT
jgi:hypothetical protein